MFPWCIYIVTIHWSQSWGPKGTKPPDWGPVPLAPCSAADADRWSDELYDQHAQYCVLCKYCRPILSVN